MANWQLIDLPRIVDPRGNLTFIEGGHHVPFPIARAYYLYDVPGGASRGGHAHRVTDELLIAVSGSFDVSVSDGTTRDVISLRRSYYGLLVPARSWRELENFSSGSVCLVLASEKFEEQEYIRDYKEFLEIVGGSDTSAPEK